MTAMKRKAAPAEPIPMPTLAPVLRPLVVVAGVEVGVGVEDAGVEEGEAAGEVGVVVAVVAWDATAVAVRVAVDGLTVGGHR